MSTTLSQPSQNNENNKVVWMIFIYHFILFSSNNMTKSSKYRQVCKARNNDVEKCWGTHLTRQMTAWKLVLTSSHNSIVVAIFFIWKLCLHHSTELSYAQSSPGLQHIMQQCTIYYKLGYMLVIWLSRADVVTVFTMPLQFHSLSYLSLLSIWLIISITDAEHGEYKTMYVYVYMLFISRLQSPDSVQSLQHLLTTIIFLV